MKNSQVIKPEKVTYLPGVSRNTKRRRLRFVLSLAVLLLVFLVGPMVPRQIHLSRLRRDLDALKTQVTAVRAQNDEMNREIERLHTPEYLEKMARQELGLVRPGEILFLFQETEPARR